jgi:ABC-type Fe3+-hydroxamate transport system substrate-binding protein
MKPTQFFFIISLLIFNTYFTSVSAKRIVSLTPSLTLNVRYLGEEGNLVGCTNYCQTTRKIPIVASAIKVNIERVIAQKPDIVIATTLTSPETIVALKKVGLKVEVFPMSHSFSEICDQFMHLAKLLGKAQKGTEIIAHSKAKLKKIEKSTTIGKKMFIQLGANPLFAVIPNTFMHEYISNAGAITITEGLTSGGITREAILRRNPDIIFIVTMGMETQKEIKKWESFKNLSATQNKKIFILDSQIACTPTPITFVQTQEIISNLLK